ncbi:hypothetical protein TrCOL_g8152 [Triparma columacea]|uniref:WW domain-containing protein n=1 Tax=Triparma columacea TaxID=722753 RepID=A0A9W7G0W6_9STRA|nr:hypothetical protein TrCOL_g8152 [Triparma columacea]
MMISASLLYILLGLVFLCGSTVASEATSTSFRPKLTDGCDGEGVTWGGMTGLPPPAGCGPRLLDEGKNLFFSAYIEQSYNARAIQIFNPTSAAVDVSNYKIFIGSEVSTATSYVENSMKTFSLCLKTDCSDDKMLPSGSSMIVSLKRTATRKSRVSELLDNDDVYGMESDLSSLTGNDWVVLAEATLANPNKIIDVIGDIGGVEESTEYSGSGSDGRQVSTNDMAIKRVVGAVPVAGRLAWDPAEWIQIEDASAIGLTMSTSPGSDVFPYFEYHISDLFECSTDADCPSCGDTLPWGSAAVNPYRCTDFPRGTVYVACQEKKCVPQDSCLAPREFEDDEHQCLPENEQTCIPRPKGGHECSTGHTYVPQCMYENCDFSVTTTFISDFYPSSDEFCNKIEPLQACIQTHCAGETILIDDEGNTMNILDILPAKIDEYKVLYCDGFVQTACYSDVEDQFNCLDTTLAGSSLFTLPSVKPGVDRSLCMDLGAYGECISEHKSAIYEGETPICTSENKETQRTLTKTLTNCYCYGICDRENTCKDNEYRSSPSDVCKECPAGTFLYNPWGLNKDSSCMPCSAGTYQDRAGQTQCNACQVGKFQNNTGSATCTDCPSGRTSPAGATSCSTDSGDGSGGGSGDGSGGGSGDGSGGGSGGGIGGPPRCVLDSGCNLAIITDSTVVSDMTAACTDVSTLLTCIQDSNKCDATTMQDVVEPMIGSQKDCFCDGNCGGSDGDTTLPPGSDMTCMSSCDMSFITETMSGILQPCSKAEEFKNCLETSSCPDEIKASFSSTTALYDSACASDSGGGSGGGDSSVNHDIAWDFSAKNNPLTVHPGDTVTFDWSTNTGEPMNVKIYPSEAQWTSCNSVNPKPSITLRDSIAKDTYVWTVPDWDGTEVYYIACSGGSGSHCSAGMKTTVTVIRPPVVSCALGEYVDDGGSCTVCPAGNKCDGTEAVLCPAGTAQPNAGSSQCDACGLGKFQGVMGAAECQDCSAGTIPSSDSTRCDNCMENTYSATSGSSSCTPCEVGETSMAGASSCSVTTCALGEYINDGGSCTVCPAGNKCDGTVAVVCPAGTAQPLTGKSSCDLCPAGTFSSLVGSVECDVCAEGTVQPSEGQSQCTTCAAGTRSSPDLTVCENCQDGWISALGSSFCEMCGPGFKSNLSKNACEECPMGTFSSSTSGNDVCTKCMENTYSPTPGSTSCTPCEDGWVSLPGSLACHQIDGSGGDSDGPPGDDKEGDGPTPTPPDDDTGPPQCVIDSGCDLAIIENEEEPDASPSSCSDIINLISCIDRDANCDATTMEDVNHILGEKKKHNCGGGDSDGPPDDGTGPPACIETCDMSFMMEIGTGSEGDGDGDGDGKGDGDGFDGMFTPEICSKITNFESCVQTSSCSDDVKASFVSVIGNFTYACSMSSCLTTCDIGSMADFGGDDTGPGSDDTGPGGDDTGPGGHGAGPSDGEGGSMTPDKLEDLGTLCTKMSELETCLDTTPSCTEEVRSKMEIDFSAMEGQCGDIMCMGACDLASISSMMSRDFDQVGAMCTKMSNLTSCLDTTPSCTEDFKSRMEIDFSALEEGCVDFECMEACDLYGFFSMMGEDAGRRWLKGDGPSAPNAGDGPSEGDGSMTPDQQFDAICTKLLDLSSCLQTAPTCSEEFEAQMLQNMTDFMSACEAIAPAPATLAPTATPPEGPPPATSSPTPAPTPSPPVKIIKVKAEVALSLSKDVWEDTGEKAFKKSVAKSLKVNPKKVVILSVEEVTVRKRMLRILTEGASRLKVDFEIDVTEVVKQKEKEEGEKVDETPPLSEEDITASVVAEVTQVIEAPALVEDIKEDTGVENLTLEVTEMPIEEIIDADILAKQQADVHDQPGSSEWKHYVSCSSDDMEMCMPTYIGGTLLILSLLCCCISCCVKCFSRPERRARAAKRHTTLATKRSKNKDFEMPSAFGGIRDSEFDGVNPMARNVQNPTVTAVDDTFPKKYNAPQLAPGWSEEVTGDGNVYYVNEATGETSWTPP